MGTTRDTGAGVRRPHQWLVPAVLLILGIAVGAAGLTTMVKSSGVQTPARSSSLTPQSRTRFGTGTADVMRRSAPVGLSIPAIGVLTSLSRLGLNTDGTVEVPTNFQQAGWFRLGPSPGQLGSAVILGHVDDRQGPAVFFNLRSLQPGDDVVVVLANHRMEHFAVTSVTTYAKASFPGRRIYGANAHRTLNLVTCGGTFDEATRSYLANVVVTTRLTSTNPAVAHLFPDSPTH